MKSLLAALLLVMAMLQAGAVAAQVLPVAELEVCPVVSDPPPDRFDTPDCRKTSLAQLDPQGRDLWVRTRVRREAVDADGRPLGLFVSGKASSEAYLNGVRLGANGRPAASRAGETPGRMDAVFPIPPGSLRAGENEIVLRLSSFHGTIHLSRPMHWIGIGPYGVPSDMFLRAYWPSLVTFGVLLAGGFFFASTALSAVNRRDPLLLSGLSILAGAQLLAEVFRGLVPYAYPEHDGRLIAIAALSAAFGVALIALVVWRFASGRRWAIFAAGVVVTLAPLLLVPGFDGKAVVSLFAATSLCVVVAAIAAFRRSRSALITSGVLAVFAASMFLFEDRFLDAIFFYEVAGAILILFAVRAAVFERERRDHEQVRLRAHDLEQALARAELPQTSPVLRINGAGSIDVVRTADITLCKGADDYVELHFIDGRTLLHSGGLTELEADLPPGFVRVHRSFIVNTAYVAKLTREASGVGVLTLSNGTSAPVSRRIMPKVRSALI